MALNSTHFFDVYLISPKSNRVAHPDSGMLGETLHTHYKTVRLQCSLAYRSTVVTELDGDGSPPSLVAAEVNVTDETRPLTSPQMLLLILFMLHQLNSEKHKIVQHISNKKIVVVKVVTHTCYKINGQYISGSPHPC